MEHLGMLGFVLVVLIRLSNCANWAHNTGLECKTTTLGEDYNGRQSTTISGKRCRKWRTKKCRQHGKQMNYCRNPNGRRPNGPWCYTVNRKVKWEYCNIPKCPNWAHNTGLEQNEWGLIYPDCNGKEQSPVNIVTNKVQYDPWLTEFNFNDHQDLTNVRMTLKNTGHAIQVDISGKKMEVNGGGLPGTYLVEQFHFHWGSDSRNGSEHRVNNRQQPMELHVVMHSDKYKNVSEAVKVTAGLAVLGILIDTGAYNSRYDQIVNELNNVKSKGDSISLLAFDITSLFASTKKYFRYYGSLTTPGCQESVIWTVFKSVATMSSGQLKEFRKLAPTKDNTLWNNWRETQPLNYRIVTSSFES